MAPADKFFVFPCGCVTRGSRDGELVDDCGDPNCYRRRRPANVVRVNRAARRANANGRPSR